MNATFSIFPKFYKHLGAEQLAELIHDVGLDTTNLVIRDGYWVTPDGLKSELPQFLKVMEAAGLKVTFATAGFSPDQLLWDPTPLKVFAENGITEFRMSYFRVQGADVRMSFQIARGKLEPLVDLCAEAKVRAVYQLHHGTLFPSASAAFGLVYGLDAEWIGVMLDPGNQNFEGYESWSTAVGLLGEYVRAVGVKDTAIARDPARADQPDKGWKRTWATLDAGETNWHDLVRALHGAAFEGTFVWMPFYHQDDPDEMTRTLKREVAYLRKVVADVQAEAAARAAEDANGETDGGQAAPS